MSSSERPTPPRRTEKFKGKGCLIVGFLAVLGVLLALVLFWVLSW